MPLQHAFNFTNFLSFQSTDSLLHMDITTESTVVSSTQIAKNFPAIGGNWSPQSHFSKAQHFVSDR